MSAPAVSAGHVVLEVDGQEATDLYPDVVRVEVELDDELAAMFRVELVVARAPDGAWRHLDDERLRPWRTVTVHAGFEDGTEPLVTGYLTHVHPTFDTDPARCRLELWGIDRSVALDREERLREWPDRRDSDIAREVLAAGGLTPRVEDTALVRDATLSTVIQRETDMALLRRLARRNGFECYVEGDEGHFHPAPAVAETAPLLAVHFGDRTSVDWLMLAVDGLAGGAVVSAGLDPMERAVRTRSVDGPPGRPLGAQTPADLLPPGVPPARAQLGTDTVADETERDTLCRATVERSAWFVTGEGVLDGGRYGTVLRPRRHVTITGIGETHSGVYRVAHVTHTFSRLGYEQRFRVCRDGIGLTGDEDFRPDAGLPGGLG